MMFPKPLVSVDWLNAHRTEVVILNATVKNPVNKEFTPATMQIPGAKFMDIDGDFSKEEVLPHMMCGTEQFEEMAGLLGITSDTPIVIYDEYGIFSAPRAWWMFKSMGHNNVSVLDGGLAEWKKAGHAVEEKTNTIHWKKQKYQATPTEKAFLSHSEILSILEDPSYSIIDARSAPRFEGKALEPREGLRSGHIPGSKNVPFGAVLDQGKLMEHTKLQTVLDPIEMDKNKKLVFSCGSGLTACILALAAQQLGYTNLSVYDGSWAEWGQPGMGPVVP